MIQTKGDEIEKMANTEPILTNDEIDAIGEVLNISMGSAATAISTMLDRQVVITTPQVQVAKFYDVSYAELEPAISVKIEYVEGISGSNVMVFRMSDMEIILNLLMGNEEGPDENFVFDELSMSAACEVMNQMMGASATALSEFLGKTINISTPEATLLDHVNTFEKAMGVDGEEKIISVAFNLCIEGVMNSDFISVMTCDLAKMIVDQVMGDQSGYASEVPVQNLEPAAAPPQQAAPPIQQQTPPPQQQMPPPPMQQQMPPPMPAQQMPGMPAQMPGMPAQMPGMPAQMPGMPAQMPGMPAQMPGMPPQPAYYPGMEQQGAYYPPYGMYPQPPYGYPGMPPQYAQSPQMGQERQVMKQAVDVKAAQFPNFAGQSVPSFATPLLKGNMDLMMNVPLSVSIEIGRTKRKIKEIMEFNQGAVIELEKQAGAPVDVVVNGQLIARGDVIVIGDNFGVRITEIIGTQEMVNSLTGN